MSFIFVKPREGLRILRPETRQELRPCGEHVPKTSFWLRRVKEGDVVICDIKKEFKKSPPKKKKETKELKQVIEKDKSTQEVK